jgi:hypothetical protein
MDTFSDIIDAFGIKRLAELLGTSESHVRTMKARDSIPPEYWPAIIANPPEGSVLTFDGLMELRTAKKRPFEVRGAA